MFMLSFTEYWRACCNGLGMGRRRSADNYLQIMWRVSTDACTMTLNSMFYYAGGTCYGR